MKKSLIKSLVLTSTLMFSFRIAQAQQIQTTSPAAIYSSVVGGARILSGQGNTAANPAIGFSGVSGQYPKSNLNDGGGGNGIFRPIANTMAFATGSAERMRITSGGLIGLNTTSPTSLLHVKCTSTNKGLRLEGVENGNGYFLVVDSDGYVKKSCAMINCNNATNEDFSKLSKELEDTKKEVERLKNIVEELQKK